MKDELTEAAPVFQRGVKAVGADIMLAFAVGMPHAVAGHAVGLPDTFLQIRRERHAGCAFKHVTQQPRAARGIGPVFARRVCAV